jgi:hypothetical protein
MAGRMISGAAALAELVRAAGEHDAPGVHRVLPVAPELSGLLPQRGLRRGSTVAVAAGRAVPAGGSTSLLLALLAEASRSGSWCAVVGLPSLGALAAQESGIDLERFALVPDPGPDWPTVIAALIDGVDVVVTAVPGRVAPTIADRLVARARQRGSVLMPFGEWPGADVTLQVTASRWEGLSLGRGRLRRREVTILARGRGAAARPKEITLWMPGLTHHPPSHPPATTGPSRPATRPTEPTPAEAPARGLRAVPSASGGSFVRSLRAVPSASGGLLGRGLRAVPSASGGSSVRSPRVAPSASGAFLIRSLRAVRSPSGGPFADSLRAVASASSGPSIRSLRAVASAEPPITGLRSDPAPSAHPHPPVPRLDGSDRRLWRTAEKCQTRLLDWSPPRTGWALFRSARQIGRALARSGRPLPFSMEPVRSGPLIAAGPPLATGAGSGAGRRDRAGSIGGRRDRAGSIAGGRSGEVWALDRAGSILDGPGQTDRDHIRAVAG